MTTKELEKRIDALEDTVKFQDKKIDWLTDAVGSLNNKSSQHHEFKVGDRVQFKTGIREEMGIVDKIYGEYADILIEKPNVPKALIRWEPLSSLALVEKPATDEPKFEIKPLEFYGGETVKNKYNQKVGKIFYGFGSKDIDNWYAVIYDDKDCDWCKEQDLEHYTEPKCKFKVGDKARVTKGRDKGEIVEIRDIRDNAISVGTLDGSCISVFDEDYLEPYTEPRWTFTDDEKVILRNLPEEFKWITRDKDNWLCVYYDEPKKEDIVWTLTKHGFAKIPFSHLFQSIKWEDEEPCEFRKFI